MKSSFILEGTTESLFLAGQQQSVCQHCWTNVENLWVEMLWKGGSLIVLFKICQRIMSVARLWDVSDKV